MTSQKPRWIPDREINNCSQCQDEFSIIRRKHHCRVCGKLFCSECSSFKLLIPTTKLLANPNKADDANAPLRTCSHCARSLHHVQEDLRQLLSKANTEIHVERLSPERYLNRPFVYSMESEIKKATHTLWNFTSDNIVEGRDRIPRDLLFGAKGLVFLTVAKVGFCFTGRIGTGLVVARLSDGSWSAPSAIGMSGLGWGFQAGLECTDVVLILATAGAVDAFSSRAQVSVGTELAVSLGPVGRSAGTDLHAGSEGASAAFSYAHSKGLFFGISLEASVITARSDVNRAFYGMDVKPAALLSGVVARPVAAEPLYRALSEVLTTTAQGPGAMSNVGALTVTSVSVSVATSVPVSTAVMVPIGVHPSGKTGAGRELDAISTAVSIRPSSAAVTSSHDSADVPSEATFLGNGGCVGGTVNSTNNIVNNSNNYINNNFNNEISSPSSGSGSGGSSNNNNSSSSSNNSNSSSKSGKREDPKQQKVQNPKAERSTDGADSLTIDSFLENLSADDGDIDYIAAAAMGPAVTQISPNESSASKPAVKNTASSVGKTSEGSELQTKSLYEEIRF